MPDLLTLCLDDNGTSRLETLLAQASAANRRIAGFRDMPALQQSPALATARLLLVSLCTPSSEQLAMLERLLDSHAQLHCLLLCDPLPPTPLLAAMRAGISSVLFWPLNPADLQQELDRLARKGAPQTSPQEGLLMAFISAKGGAGTTFIACNLANALSRHRRVLLLDLNRQFSDADLYLGECQASNTVCDLFSRADRLDAGLFKVCVHSINPALDLLVGPGDPIRGAALAAEHLPTILRLARTQYPCVVVELGQSIDALTIAVLDQAQQIFTVLRQDLLHLYAGKRLLAILHELGYHRDQLQLLINRFDKKSPISLKAVRETLDSVPCRTLADEPVAAKRSLSEGRLLQQVAPRCRLQRELEVLAASFNPPPAVPAKARHWAPWCKLASQPSLA